MNIAPTRRPLSAAALVSFAYLGAGVLWILLSDQLGALLFSDSAAITSFQTYKGWLFVGATALVFYLVLRHTAQPQDADAASGLAASGVPERLSLQSLLILLVLATAVPLAGLLAYNVQREAAAEIDKAGLALGRLVDNTADDIAAELAEFERIATYMATRPKVRQLDPFDCDSRFGELMKLYPHLANVATVNLRGDAICTQIRPSSGVRPNIGAVPWFAELKRSNKFVIGSPQKGLYTGRWILVLAYPIRDAAGAVAGAMQLVVGLEAFRPVVSANPPQGAVTAVLDGNATVVASSLRPERVVGQNFRERGVSPIVLERRQGTAVAVGIDGVERIYAFKPIGGSGWYALTGIPTDSLYAESQRAVWRNLAVGLVILLLVVALVVRTHRRIVRPMGQLGAAAQSIADGDFSARAPVAGPEEMVQVAIAVNHALDRMGRSEAQFRALTTLASDWYWETDAAHRFTLMSAGVQDGQVGGFEPAQFIGKTRWELGEIETAEAEMQRYRKLMERREPFQDFEIVRRDSAGRMRRALISGEPMFDAAGAFTGYRGVGHSITARREAEDRLRRSEQYYRSLFDASPDAIRVICDDRVVMLNPAGMRLFGVDASAGQVGQLVYDTIHPDFLEIARRRIRQVIEGRVAVPPSEQALLRADGRVVDVEVMTLPFEYDGRPAALSIVHDLTERKNAERELRRVNTELEERVRQRSIELGEANRSLESFSYTVAHDLRAPLRSISGFAALLDEGSGPRLGSEARGFLDRIRKSAASMNLLIEGLLSLSRLGRAKLHVMPVDLSALAASSLQELRERDPGRQVDAVIEPGMVASGDLHLLKNVFDNLLGNAWKFTSGKARARIEVGSVAHQGGVAYFVRDDGAGFDPGYADKLFGTFQRLHTGEEFPGIGIGLASVRRIIENHGGAVWAEGAVGRGASFHFTLSGKAFDAPA